LRLLPQIVRETEPNLVLYLGVGAGAHPEHQGGDVAVTNKARFKLRGELEGSPLNDQTFGGVWEPAPGIFQGLAFAELQEPQLLPPSPHYENIPPPQPPKHTPKVRVEALPVITRPLVSDINALFEIPSPNPEDSSYWWGEDGCAVDMDAASVGAVCGERLPCAFVIGIVSPAIHRFKYDFESNLRLAWAKHMIREFATQATINAAQVVRRIIEFA
jgi:hypothetical protein